MGTVTRLELFKDILLELGDKITLTATATGTTTTFISTTDMIFADGSLNGREAWYSFSNGGGSAANLATRRLVTGTDQSSGALAVQPAWSAAPITGDILVLANSRGTGVTIPEIHDKINQLIRRVRTQLATEIADTPATFAATSPNINIPTTWDGFLGIQMESDPTMVGVWEHIPGKPYTINHWDSPKTVTIKATHRGLFAGKRLRLIGVSDLAELTTDSATTTAPASWLSKTAAFELLEAAALRSGDVATAYTYGELLKQQAQELVVYTSKRFSLGPRIELRQ